MGCPSLLTTENQKLNEAKIAAIQDVELWYKRYRHAELSSQSELLEEIIEGVDNKTKDNVIHSESQLIEFINNVFLINNPQNEEVYECLCMSSDQIFSITKRHTSLYQDKNIGALTQFSKKCGAEYLKAQISRKCIKNSRTERKIIYLMKEKDRAYNLANSQKIYDCCISKLKTDGLEIIGHARKSPGEPSNDEREANPQNMIYINPLATDPLNDTLIRYNKRVKEF